MLINKTVVFLVASLAVCAVLFFAVLPLVAPTDLPQISDSTTASIAGASDAWDRVSKQYQVPGLPSFDLLGAAMLIFPAVGIVIGADFLVRRKTDSVIKRLFTSPKDKR